ncbi:hypothetical protein GALMADRAFT_237390 [Galerina marginata CBS 339.88]|uniref:Nephrocystin 3-like N-terminal domain-containing protein n=1 Tax=Galerina marginata (strain CBS 339.88) TaxID=685588 RepID=A0A067TMS3_GALM3|nr:hypothetical protein GALMADRAFT_237390 [Galerina marginata CBS 339.88]
MDWVSGNGASESDSQIQSGQAFMMLVYAAQGTRTALAQTIAERCQQDNTLLASFFFSHADASHNHARSLVATMSYQVALTLPATKELVVAAVERDPLIFFKSLETQFLRLVIEPLHSASNHLHSSGSSLPHLVVIDALDECDDEAVRTRILRLLFRTHREGALPPKVRFLLTTQPTSDVTAIISSQQSNDAPTCLMLTGAYHRDEDIRLFLHNRFQNITVDHPKRADIPPGWPSNHDVEELVRRASGQFIYALTVIRYVSSESHNPPTRLRIVLGLCPPRRHSLLSDLDALYTHILSTVDDTDINTVLRILGLIILGHYPSAELIKGILGLEHGATTTLFQKIDTLVYVTAASSPQVELHHPSLPAFLLDESRSRGLHLNPALRHAEYAHLCFERIFTPSIDKIDLLIFQSLIHHLEMAAPTTQIRQDIREFPDMEVARAWARRQLGFPQFFFIFGGSFLSVIRELHWNWDDMEELYTILNGRLAELRSIVDLWPSRPSVDRR